MFASCRSLPVLFFLIASLSLTLAGCDLFGAESQDTSRLSEARVVVGSGGVFGRDNGTLTVYDPATGARSETNTNGFLNSLTFHGGHLYALLNFSTGGGVARVYEAGSYSQPVGQIPFEAPPRAMAFADEEAAFVTLQGPFDASFNPLPSTTVMVDLEANAVVDSAEVGRQPEGLAVAEGKVFVANNGSGTLSVIDAASGAAAGTVALDCTHPNEVFVDGEGEVVVVCEGGAAAGAQILFLDPDTETVTERLRLEIPLGSINFTQSAYFSAPAEALYAISTSTGQVVRVDTDANALVGRLAVPEDEALAGLAAVAYDAAGDRLYVARLPVGDDGASPDYAAAGTVVLLDAEGQQVGAFRVGPSPAHIALRHETGD